MSLWSRVRNVFRGDGLNRDLDEEMQSHIEEAIEHGRDPEEARRAFGSALRHREQSRDLKLATWLDSIRADAVFGWRQMVKNKVTAGAAIVSLALAIGACTSAFRLIDAVLLRPLPVAAPDRLYVLTYEYIDPSGKPQSGDGWEYPQFRELRKALGGEGNLIAISYASRIDLTYTSPHEMERAYRQYVSGWMFGSFGLRPALGRLLTEDDDRQPGKHPVAVLSYDYWQRRFGGDPKALGRTFKIGETSYEIVGVGPQGFTGTEPGTLTDLFTPTMMNHRAINNANWSWFRMWLHRDAGAGEHALRDKLQAAMTAWRKENVKGWGASVPKARADSYVGAPLVLQRAAAGVSGMQKVYRQSLLIIGVVVALVLLIAAANVANLMLAKSAARARELALRVSIGAGRGRLIQLVLVESAMLALIATAVGGLFAWWSAPAVVGMLNPPDNPARLVLPADWRVLGFAASLAMAVTLLFGLAPALRASGVKPMSALRGGEDPRVRRRLMNSLVAAQVAFCFLVHFLAGLFVATFDRISHEPTGFISERVLTLETVARAEEPVAVWEQVAEHLRSVPQVQSAALCSWALMSGNGWSSDVRVNGKQPGTEEPYFLGVSRGWLETMRIPMIDGRDFNADEAYPEVAIVNEAFARRYFDGQNPVGRSFDHSERDQILAVRIVGLVRDAKYRNVREPIRATVYVPFSSRGEKVSLRPKDWSTFVVRTATADPLAIAQSLRQEVTRVRPDFRVSSIRTQTELVQQHTVRERLLALLSSFFAVVALVLAAVGLYGVLTYSVLQRKREIGIRIALGARTGEVARRLTGEVFAMLLIGSLAGLAAGAGLERYIEKLLYGVKSTSVTMLALPVITIAAAAILAALPPVLRAARIDPAVTLRSE